MFGRKGLGRPGEIDLTGVGILDRSHEFARLWSEPNGPVTCIIEPRALGPDPFLFGMVLVDALRHGAKAYARAGGISERDALARIWEGFDAERINPTDDPRPVDPTGNSH